MPKNKKTTVIPAIAITAVPAIIANALPAIPDGIHAKIGALLKAPKEGKIELLDSLVIKRTTSKGAPSHEFPLYGQLKSMLKKAGIVQSNSQLDVWYGPRKAAWFAAVAAEEEDSKRRGILPCKVSWNAAGTIRNQKSKMPIGAKSLREENAELRKKLAELESKKA